MKINTTNYIIENITKNEEILKNLLGGDIFSHRKEPDDTTFIVARQWNSWHPSYFSVIGGGSYLIQTAKAYSENGSEPDKTKSPANKDKFLKNKESMPPEKPRIILVDPGFKFLQTVQSLGADVDDIDTVIITHFHPDHMNGIFEYINLRLNIERPTTIYMNPTSHNALGQAVSRNVVIFELAPSSVFSLAKYKRNDLIYERITVRAIQTYQTEITNVSNAIGLIFEIEQSDSSLFKKIIKQKTIGILGDTDAHPKHLEEYVNEFYKCDVLVLHVGTFASKAVGEPGKHLYLEGTECLLEKLKEKDTISGEKKLILLSEFGLENSALDQFYSAVVEKFRVRPVQAILGYYIEQGEISKSEGTAKLKHEYAAIAYAYWFYHWLVRSQAYSGPSALLVALGYGCKLFAPDECEQLFPKSISKGDATGRDNILQRIIDEIEKNIRYSGSKLPELMGWSTKFLVDAIQLRLNPYDEKSSIESTIDKQLERLESSLDILKESTKKALQRLFWRIIEIPLFDEIVDEIIAIKERIPEDIKDKYPNIKNIEWDKILDGSDKTREYNGEAFQELLLCTMIAINCLNEAKKNVKIEIMKTIPDIDKQPKQIPLKLIEEELREENDWCTLLIADIGCEVVLGKEIKMKTYDGRKLSPKKIKSRYVGGRLKRLIYEQI